MAEPKLDDRWDPKPERLEGGRLCYRLRSGRYSLVQNDHDSWAVLPPDGIPLAEGLPFDSARQMAEKHDVQDTRAQVRVEER